MNARLRDELIRMANVYSNNLTADINNSSAKQETKKLAEMVRDNTHAVLVAFAHEIANET